MCQGFGGGEGERTFMFVYVHACMYLCVCVCVYLDCVIHIVSGRREVWDCKQSLLLPSATALLYEEQIVNVPTLLDIITRNANFDHTQPFAPGSCEFHFSRTLPLEQTPVSRLHPQLRSVQGQVSARPAADVGVRGGGEAQTDGPG